MLAENALHGGHACLPSAVGVVESGFQHTVVNGYDRVGEGSRFLHLLERAYAAGRFLGHSNEVRREFGAFERSETGEAGTIVDDDVRLYFVQQVQGRLVRLFRGPVSAGFDRDSFPAQLFRHSGIRGIRAAIYADDCAGGLKLAQQNRGLWLQYQTDGNTNA